MQILVRCDQPSQLAAHLFQQNHVVEAKIHADGHGLLLRTTRRRQLLPAAEPRVLESGLEVESVAPADDDVNSVYQYLIGGEGGHDMNLWMRQIGGRAPPRIEEDVPLAARLVGLFPGARPGGAHAAALADRDAPASLAAGHSLGEDSDGLRRHVPVLLSAPGHFLRLRGHLLEPLPRRDAGEDAALLFPDAAAPRTAGGRQVSGRDWPRRWFCSWAARRSRSC